MQKTSEHQHSLFVEITLIEEEHLSGGGILGYIWDGVKTVGKTVGQGTWQVIKGTVTSPKFLIGLALLGGYYAADNYCVDANGNTQCMPKQPGSWS